MGRIDHSGEASGRASGKTKILQLVHGLELGGTEVIASSLADTLGSEFDLRYVCLDELGPLAEKLRSNGVAVDLLGRKSGLDLSLIRRLRKVIKRCRPAVIHAHQMTPFIYALLARPGLGVPILLTEHGRFHPDGPHPKRAFLSKLLTAKGDALVAVGEQVKAALVNFEGMPAARIEVVYNGIDLAPFRPSGTTESEKVRGQIRASLGLDESHRAALLIARLDPIKNHTMAIEATAKIAASDSNFRLLLAGDGPERGRIEALIAEKDLADHVLVLGSRQDVPDLLCGSDVAWLTSRSEGIPLVVLEAMASGVPVISTDVGGCSELIDPDQTGLLVSDNDATALATATLLLRDQELSGTLREKSLAMVRERFTLEAMGRHYRQIYSRLVAS